MLLKELDKKALALVYENHMKNDFPPNEIKPLPLILSLMDVGRYFAYGFFDEDELYGYALFTSTSDGRDLLLDYFAVCSPYRSLGYGGLFLHMLKERFQEEYRCMIVEVEAIDHAESEADARIRYRRLSFYERNGLRHTALTSHLLGGHFIILLIDLQNVAEDETIRAALIDIYSLYFGTDYVHEKGLIECASHSTLYAGVDYAQTTC